MNVREEGEGSSGLGGTRAISKENVENWGGGGREVG